MSKIGNFDPMSRKLFISSIIAIIVIGFFVASYIYNNLSQRPVLAQTEVIRGNVSQVLNINGKVKPEITAELGFETGGRIVALNYKVGDKVSKNAIIAKANDADLVAQYASDVAEIESAKAIRDQLEELRDKSEYDLKALKSPNNTSNDKKAQREQIDADKAAIEAQEARIAALEDTARSDLANINKTVIRAPFSGVIAKQDVEIGEVAQSNIPILTIVDNQNFKIEALASEIDVKSIHKGNLAKITLDNVSSTEYDAQVTDIDPAETLINGVSNYKITLHFNAKDIAIISGTDANISLILTSRDNVLVIPESSILEENNKKYVYVLTNETKELKEITAGIYGANNKVEVLAGLSEGDKIFTSNQ